MTKITEYIGRHISKLLESEPFSRWTVERSIEDDLEPPIIQYVFAGQGVEVRCDQHDLIDVIFLEPTAADGLAQCGLESHFSADRLDIRRRYGVPTKSGDRMCDPVLGDYGAWDRFSLSTHAIHFEYCLNNKGVCKITLMRRDAVPA